MDLFHQFLVSTRFIRRFGGGMGLFNLINFIHKQGTVKDTTMGTSERLRRTITDAAVQNIQVNNKPILSE